MRTGPLHSKINTVGKCATYTTGNLNCSNERIYILRMRELNKKELDNDRHTLSEVNGEYSTNVNTVNAQ